MRTAFLLTVALTVFAPAALATDELAAARTAPSPALAWLPVTGT